MKKYVTIIAALMLLFFITGCNTTTSGNKKTKEDPIIYTSIYPIQYVTEQIAGDAITVESVYPPGVDAHSYEPTSREMTAIAKGDAFIYLGAGMEAFAESAAKALQNQDVKFIEIAKIDESLFSKANVDEDEHDHDGHDEHADHDEHDHDGHDEHADHDEHDHDGHDEHADHDEHDHDGHDGHDHHHHGDKDPHIWLDPLRMIKIGEIVKDELSKLYPEQVETFNKNFDTFKIEITDLDAAFKQTLENIEHKHILVAHAAYGYWEERYGIEQIAISGLSTSQEPSQKELTQIVELAKEHNLNYVIFEQTGTDRVSDIIREHLHAEALYIHNLESLTDADMKNKEDYLTIMKKNLEVLHKALD